MKYAVVIGTQRSGTTVLRSLLQTHPEVQTFGEVFLHRHVHMLECYYHFLRERARKNPDVVVAAPNHCCKLFDEYFDHLETLAKSDTSILLLDCKYNFLLGVNPTGDHNWGQRPFLLQQFERKGCRLIHIIRENVLATYVSSLLSIKNQVWATDDLSRVNQRTTEVPTAHLLEILRHRRAEQVHFQNLLSGPNTLTIYYESMFDQTGFTPRVLNELANFLGVSNEFLDKPMLKKIALPINQAIENLVEVQQLLEDTEFSSLTS